MTMAWTLFAIYLAGTAYLGWLGYKRTTGFSSFAVGNKDIHPVVVGITLAASTASASTFIINPGFVYVDGLSAWLHMVVGAGVGFMTMLCILSFQFRRIGEQTRALTIPDWIGKRYQSRGFALYFSFLNLLSFAFVVLLVGGISIVMQSLLGISNVTALTITLVFVTGYVFVGGTYAHVLTNVLQGSLMIGVTILVLGVCVFLVFSDSTPVADRLTQSDPYLLDWIKRDGVLFNDWYSVFIAGFVVGAVIVCQPHILTKALYVKSDSEVRQYLVVFGIIFLLFQLLGSVGFFAHLAVPESALIDPGTGAFRQDLVMTIFLKSVFPEWVFTIVSIVLLAAAMSTLDGLLVSMSTITANDLVLNLFSTDPSIDPEKRMALAMKVSHVVLVFIAIAAFIINLEPPRLLGIFGQVGVYGMAAAAAPPLLIGVLFRDVPFGLVWIGSVVALTLHFALFFFGASIFPGSPLTFSNPGVTASIASLAVIPLLVVVSYSLNSSR